MRDKRFLMILLMISVIAGCGKSSIHMEDACIGVLETNGYSKNSRLRIYDDQLTEITNVPIKYASVGNIFYNPLIYNQELYVVPQGSANKKDEQKVLAINLNNFEEKIYDIEQFAINSICADHEYIYTCNTLNADSYISKCSKSDKTVNTQIIKNAYVSKIVCADGAIYAFGMIKRKNGLQSYIYLLDQELHLTEKIDISEYGSSHYKAIVHDNKIFFSNTLDSKDHPCNTVCVFSIKDQTFDTIQLSQNYPQDLVLYHDILIVSHYDLIRREGGSISFYDLNTKKVWNCPLEHGVEQMALKDDNLYILSENKIYKYKIAESGIKLEKMNDIDMLSAKNYCSGVFAYDVLSK